MRKRFNYKVVYLVKIYKFFYKLNYFVIRGHLNISHRFKFGWLVPASREVSAGRDGQQKLPYQFVRMRLPYRFRGNRQGRGWRRPYLISVVVLI